MTFELFVIVSILVIVARIFLPAFLGWLISPVRKVVSTSLLPREIELEKGSLGYAAFSVLKGTKDKVKSFSRDIKAARIKAAEVPKEKVVVRFWD